MLTPDSVRRKAIALKSPAAEENSLFDEIAGAKFALLGEASHGTQDFYRERAEITKRLVSEQGFTCIAVEADWPDAYRVNRYVRGLGPDKTAAQALSDFERFPVWMWRNTEVAGFIEWLRDFNRNRSEPVGFYGLDLYSLYDSIDAVINYLERIDPDLAADARVLYACFDQYQRDPQLYGYAVNYAGMASCEEAVVKQLSRVERLSTLVRSTGDQRLEDEAFFAEQNARLIKNAERYYLAMYRSSAESWNLRDLHMAETLESLLAYQVRHISEPKAVVWAHNSHIGDAAATEMSSRGELNLGHLLHQKHGASVYGVGFTTHSGTVTAAREWGGPAEQRYVRPSLEGSFERLFHETELGRFLVFARDLIGDRRLERAIGVIYRPEFERQSHYFEAEISSQFDAVIHVDRTEALEPLEVTDLWREAEPPEPPMVPEEVVRA